MLEYVILYVVADILYGICDIVCAYMYPVFIYVKLCLVADIPYCNMYDGLGVTTLPPPKRGVCAL